mmetsp:Transcript_29271/g.48379  ORF Transcript_29271/g.48379 Transcript_29271/m.48379 type:complete len:237 (-) Transcript_29271:335-1045(-)
MLNILRSQSTCYKQATGWNPFNRGRANLRSIGTNHDLECLLAQTSILGVDRDNFSLHVTSTQKFIMHCFIHLIWEFSGQELVDVGEAHAGNDTFSRDSMLVSELVHQVGAQLDFQVGSWVVLHVPTFTWKTAIGSISVGSKVALSQSCSSTNTDLWSIAINHFVRSRSQLLDFRVVESQATVALCYKIIDDQCTVDLADVNLLRKDIFLDRRSINVDPEIAHVNLVVPDRTSTGET